MTVIRTLAVAAAALMVACASDPATEPEPEFGSSVRHMVRSQTFNPQAGKATQSPAGMDGPKSEAALKAYRADNSGKPGAARDPASDAGQSSRE